MMCTVRSESQPFKRYDSIERKAQTSWTDGVLVTVAARCTLHHCELYRVPHTSDCVYLV